MQFSKTFTSLKIRNYRLYFIGQSISLSGTWMQTVGQSWLVLQLTKSGTALGFVLACQFLPILFFAPYGGLIADRFPKRKLLLITQSISGILALILGILVLSGFIELWMIYVLALALGLVNAIDNPTRQSFTNEMVDKKILPNAIGLLGIQINLARVVGPAIAGIVILFTGIGMCFIINGLSYIGVIIALLMMNTKELMPFPLVEKTKGQMLEGFKYIKSNPTIKNTLIMMAIIGTFTYEFVVTLPLMAEYTFHGDAGTYAFLTSALGVGSVIGGFFVANQKKKEEKTLAKIACLFGISVLLVSIAPTLLLAILLLILAGFFSIYFSASGNVTLQTSSKPEMRGRVMAMWAVVFLGTTPIGSPIVGFIGQNAGPRWSLALGGIAAIVAGLIGYFSFKNIKSAKIPKTENLTS